ncbi:hypothetical protein ACQEVG_32995 [Streptomyces sp. CA-135486]|uniref:hypothetical protein n=1 Tax=Streptomyces sp. CA-135486 TaxID=3240049 RepID=UPI003D900AE2
MNKVYERIENGITTHVSIREAMDEVNHAMMEGKREVRQMSSGRTAHWIDYRDGRTVRMTLVDAPAPVETDSEGRRIVTVKGKLYVVSAVTPARPKVEGVPSWVPEAYVSYWSGGLLGQPSGPTRHASASRRPGTVGRAIWDAVNR